MFALRHLLADTFAQRYQRELLWAGVAIALVLLLAASILWWMRRFNQRRGPFTLKASDQLAHFRVLYERGELSSEEFQRLRALLNERIRAELASQESAAAAPETTSATLDKPKPDGPTNNGPPNPGGS